jgi:hypothetical protein
MVIVNRENILVHVSFNVVILLYLLLMSSLKSRYVFTLPNEVLTD